MASKYYAVKRERFPGYISTGMIAKQWLTISGSSV